MIGRRQFLGLSAAAIAAAGCSTVGHGASRGLIGYTEYRTNLPTRYDNQITARACVVGDDGRGRRELAPALVKEAHAWTQFAGWSPDGRYAIIGRGWETPENGAWEEANKNRGSHLIRAQAVD